MKRTNEMTLEEAMERLVDTYGLREKLDERAIVSLWDNMVGGMIAHRTISLRLRRGKLRIKVDSAPLRQELSFMREKMKENINRELGREVVKEVELD